jgi:hypothetical protein
VITRVCNAEYGPLPEAMTLVCNIDGACNLHIGPYERMSRTQRTDGAIVHQPGDHRR